jgi:signal transduction histidine kinase
LRVAHADYTLSKTIDTKPVATNSCRFPYLSAWIQSNRKEPNSIEVTIRDNGIGVKPEHLSKISDMGWSTKAVGLGFGLFWAKDFIEGLNGKLQAESEWGKGTTFRIDIPYMNAG